MSLRNGTVSRVASFTLVGLIDWLGLFSWLKLQWFCTDARYDLLVGDAAGRFMFHLFV